MSAVPVIDKAWTQRPPDEKGVPTFIAREGLPIWRLLLSGFNQFFLGLINGTVDIFGVLIRFGTGVPTAADPDGSVYVRTDPPTATTWLYYRFGGAWILFAGGGSGGLALTDFIQNVGGGTSGHFTIAGAGFTAGKDVLIVQTAQPIPSKGNARDELEMDAIVLTGYVMDAATIQVYWRATGIVVGDYAFAYAVAA